MVERKHGGPSGGSSTTQELKQQWEKQIEYARELIYHGDYQKSLEEYQKVIQDIREELHMIPTNGSEQDDETELDELLAIIT